MNQEPQQDKRKTAKGKGMIPKFSMSWIYIAVFIGLLGLQMMQGSFSNQVLPSDFNDLAERLAQGHIERVRVVNDKEVQIFIKEDILISHADYEELAESATGDDINPGPHLSFEMPSESLDRNLDRFYQQNPSFWNKINPC